MFCAPAVRGRQVCVLHPAALTFSTYMYPFLSIIALVAGASALYLLQNLLARENTTGAIFVFVVLCFFLLIVCSFVNRIIGSEDDEEEEDDDSQAR